MTEKNRQLLEFINQGRTTNEICNIMKLSYKQLLARLLQLKKWGIQLDRKYYYDGESTYQISKLLKEKEKEEVTIITRKEDDHFRAILISDLHIGNEKERIDALEKIYNYAIKENIHIVLNAGDVIDGTIGTKKKHKTILEQIEYALKSYPYDKNILNFICLGNHDASSKENHGFDFGQIIENNRPDLIPVGYGKGMIHVKNDSIFLTHPISGISGSAALNGLVLKGHSHEIKFVENGLSYYFYLPSLSELTVNYKPAFPCAFLMDLKMKDGYFHQGVFNQLLVDSKVFCLNELVYDLSRGKPLNGLVKNEEERKVYITSPASLTETKEDSKRVEEAVKAAPVLVKKQQSQIEKFNQRYGYKNSSIK